MYATSVLLLIFIEINKFLRYREFERLSMSVTLFWEASRFYYSAFVRNDYFLCLKDCRRRLCRDQFKEKASFQFQKRRLSISAATRVVAKSAIMSFSTSLWRWSISLSLCFRNHDFKVVFTFEKPTQRYSISLWGMILQRKEISRMYVSDFACWKQDEKARTFPSWQRSQWTIDDIVCHPDRSKIRIDVIYEQRESGMSYTVND